MQAMNGATPIRSMRRSTPTLAKLFTFEVYHTQRVKLPKDLSNFNPGNSRDTVIATIDDSRAQACNQPLRICMS